MPTARGPNRFTLEVRIASGCPRSDHFRLFCRIISYTLLHSSFFKGSAWQRAVESRSICRMRRMSTRQSPDMGIRRVLARQVRRDDSMLPRIFRINYCGHCKSNPLSCCLSRSLTKSRPILATRSRRPSRIFNYFILLLSCTRLRG